MMAADALAVIQTTIGLIFLLSCVGKLRDVSGFLGGVIAYQILPKPLAVTYGLFVIPFEGFVALALLSRWHPDLGAAVAAVLLGTFFIAVALNLHRHRPLSCYCFGATSNEQISRRVLGRVALLLLVALAILVLPPSHAATVMAWTEVALTYLLSVFVLIIGSWAFTLPELFAPQEKSAS